jgi:hypothetical protein
MKMLRKFARTQVARAWPDEFEVHRCFCADAPNTDGMNRAAEANAAIGEKALEWYQQIYAESAPDRRRAADVALAQSQAQTELARFSLDRSRQEAQRFDTTFKPIEAKIAADAMAYDTPERREAEARQAVADTQIALANARQSSKRAMERRGVMPGSGASLALQGSMDLGAAKLSAGAANTARERVATVGAAKMMDAAGLGRGVVSNQATQAQIGLQAGNSGVNNAMVPLSIAQQGAQLGGQGFQTAIGANNSAGQLYGQIAGLQSGIDAQNNQSAMAGASTIATVGIAI